MKKSTYVIIGIIIILMIVVICAFAFLGNDKKENNEINNKVMNEESDIIQNEQTNEQVNEVVSNEAKNDIVNESTNIVENVLENTTSSETFEESPKTAEEKAIDIAKKDFGKNNNAQFSVEGMDGNGNYIVAVRDTKTTEALAFYTVNVANKTFTKREMN